MAPHVLRTAVEYDIPCVWLVWNNFAWAAIRDIQYGMFGGREIGTGFYKGETVNPTTPTSRRGRARAAPTASPSRVPTTSKGAVAHALRHRRPCVIDVHVDANVRPPATGTWQLPPIPYKEPVYGKPYVA